MPELLFLLIIMDQKEISQFIRTAVNRWLYSYNAEAVLDQFDQRTIRLLIMRPDESKPLLSTEDFIEEQLNWFLNTKFGLGVKILYSYK